MVDALPGSSRIAFTGTSGRLFVRSCHDAPPFVVLYTCPEPNPENVTNATCASLASTARSVTNRFGNPESTKFQVVPPLVVTCSCASLVPT